MKSKEKSKDNNPKIVTALLSSCRRLWGKEGRKYLIVGATAVVICRREKGGEGIIGEGNRAGSTCSTRSVDIEPYPSRQATTIGDAIGLASSPATATMWLPIDGVKNRIASFVRSLITSELLSAFTNTSLKTAGPNLRDTQIPTQQ